MPPELKPHQPALLQRRRQELEAHCRHGEGSMASVRAMQATQRSSELCIEFRHAGITSGQVAAFLGLQLSSKARGDKQGKAQQAAGQPPRLHDRPGATAAQPEPQVEVDGLPSMRQPQLSEAIKRLQAGAMADDLQDAAGRPKWQLSYL